MKDRFMILTIVLLMFLFLSVHVLAMKISDSGKANAIIVLGSDATESEKTAATELVKYLKLISGADFQIKSDASDSQNNIFIGQTKITNDKLGGFDWNSLKSDGIIIKSSKSSLILAGDRPRGTLYAVYDFLENYLDCKFWTSKAEFVPNNGTINISDHINYKYVPPFFSRETYYKDNIANPYFAVKCKSNGHYNNIPEGLGGYIELIGFVHTFDRLIPHSNFEAHPEWFSLVDGKRVPNAQLCLSNPELLENLADSVIKTLDNSKNPRLISVSQNDNPVPCQCENCQRLTKQFGSHSGLLIYAINYVADKVKEKYPDVMIETLAYQYTLAAPTNIKPAENVIVRLCDIESNFGEPLADKSKNKPYTVVKNCRIFDYVNQQTVNEDYCKSLEAWSKISSNIFIWDYTVNFNNYHIIHPNFYSLKSNINLFKKNNAKAIFEQGDCFNDGPAFNHLKSYMISRLLWDPTLDDDKLIREFLKGYYGDADKYLYDFLQLCRNAINSKHIFLSTYMNDSSWLSADEMIEAFKLFNLAISQVSDNIVLRDRVMTEMLSFQVGWYHADPDTQKKVADSGYLFYTDPNVFADKYYDFCIEHDNSFYSESRSITYSVFAPEKKLRKAGNTPKECEALPEDVWIEFNNTEFDLTKSESYCKQIVDTKAVESSATVMFSNHAEWCVSRNLTKTMNNLALQGIKSIEMYVVCKINNKKSDIGNAFEIGLWDTENGGLRYRRFVEAKGLSDEYITVPVGELSVAKTSGCLLYFAPCNNIDMGDAVVIDRVFGILKK